MGVEENVQIVEEGLEAFNAHDWGRFFSRYHESVVEYAPELTEPVKGVAALRERFENGAEAFPDQRIDGVRTFGQGDWVCLEGVFRGTQTGPFVGPGGRTIPATNKRVELWVALVFKIEAGKVTEEHDYYDNMTFMSQLGLAP